MAKIPVKGGLITAYPNPAAEIIRQQISPTETLDASSARVYLYDQLFDKVRRTVFLNNSFGSVNYPQKYEIELDVRDLPRGIYYLQVVTNKDYKIPFIRMLLK